MKKHMAGALSLIGLLGAYLVLRYLLFSLHGMKELPFNLFIIGAVIIIISGMAFSRKILPVLTPVGYIVGFVLGYFFQFDYGVGLNSLWIIWIGVYLGVVLVGIVAEIICWKRKAN